MKEDIPAAATGYTIEGVEAGTSDENLADFSFCDIMKKSEKSD